MTQAPNFGVPRSGPVAPDVMAGRIDDNFDAQISSHSGASRPTYAVAGTLWLSTATAGKHKYYFFDGTNDHLVITIDTATGAVTYNDGVGDDPFLKKTGGIMTGDLDLGGFAAKGAATLNGGPLGGLRDVIINGDGAVSQRTYATVADDVYWCDRHYVLTQTAAITPTVISDVANGLPKMMRLTQSQATAQRMGNAQIIEAAAAKRLRGKQITLGGFLRCSSSQAIRYAVLEWTGTADTVTSDVVNSWTNASFTAGQFFLGSNLTVAAVGTITPSAATLTPWSQTANISSSCNNLIVIMWTEGTAAQNVTLDMAWGLVQGDATKETWPYAPRHIQQELALCQRYYTNGVGVGTVYWPPSSSAGAARRAFIGFPVQMRAVPTCFIGSSNIASPSVAPVNVNGVNVFGTPGADVECAITSSSFDAEL
ncbi:hypothetical protein ACXHXM_16830